MNENPMRDGGQLVPYLKERKRSTVQKVIFLLAIVGIIAAICITLIKSDGGFLGGFFKKGTETTTSAETTTAPTKSDIYDYDSSVVPEGENGVIPADLSAAKQEKRFEANASSLTVDSSKLKKVSEGKVSVLIVCSHPYESYCKEKILSYGKDFCPVGGEETVDALARELTVSLLSLGVGAEYLDTGITSANGSYATAQAKITEYLRSHPDVVYVIDLHRAVISDSNDNLLCPITEKDGDIYAQMRFAVGTVGGKPSKSLPTVNALFDVISERFSSLIMPIEAADAPICQDLDPTVITLDIGSCANTYSSAENTAKYFALIFSEAVKP